MPTMTEAEATSEIILRLLRERGQLDAIKLDAYRTLKSKDDDIAERILIRAGLATDVQIGEAYAEHLGLPLQLSDDLTTGVGDILRYLPEKLARDQIIVPLSVEGDTIVLGFATPSALLIFDEVQLLTGLLVRPVVSTLTVPTALPATALTPRAAAEPPIFRPAGTWCIGNK